MAKKNAELEKLDKDKNRLLGMAAHDLRSPLGVIFNYAQFLESETASVLNAEQREFVTTIKDMSEFMLRMVTDILDVTAIEAGELKLDRQPTDLVHLIQHNVTLNRVLAAQKDITLEFKSQRPPPRCSFDAGKVEQVLNNLISNSIKFSHRGTCVRILLTCTDEVVTVAVADQGQGIPAADFSEVVQGFQYDQRAAARPVNRARAWGSPLCAGSSKVTVVASGSRAKSVRAPLSISRCRSIAKRPEPITPCPYRAAQGDNLYPAHRE